MPRINALIASGVDVSSRWESLGRTPLHVATIGGHLDAAVALIDAGADVDARVHVMLGGGCTVLHLAACHHRPKIANALINAGANVEARTGALSSPAHTSLMYGRRSILKLLLRAGATTSEHGGPGEQTVSRIPHREAAFALLDSVNAAGGWDDFVLRHRAIIKSIVSKCAPLPDDCLLTIAAFICPPGGW